MLSSTKLLEVTYSESPQVDRDAGVIRGVKILGRRSKNRRVYSDAALNQAAYFYEGLAVNLDHPRSPGNAAGRAVADGFGWLTSVGVRDDGVYGDLHYLRSHPQAAMIAEAAERNPRRFGLSHNAVGRVSPRDGELVVESIEQVHSVDLVQNPATSQGLFESESEGDSPAPAECESPAESPSQSPSPSTSVSPVPFNPEARPPMSRHAESRPTLQQLCEQAELPGLLAHPGLAPLRDRPVDSLSLPGTGPADLRPILLATVLRELAEQTAAQTGLLQTGVFTHLESQLGSRAGQSSGPGLADLAARIDRLELEASCRSLLEQHNRSADPTRLRALTEAASDEARRQLIESWPTRDQLPRHRPLNSPPLHPREPAERLPEDVRGFVAVLHSARE